MSAARGLRRAPVRITLIDRRNHHVFQPMLYQVATAALAPSQIAAPIRGIVGSQRNCEVLLGEAMRVEPDRRVVVLRDGEVAYDYLILATGVTPAYFGNDAWAGAAPPLKTIEDALEIRRRFLLAFERAERENDPALRDALITFVIVGAGPTGVEMAGAMMEIALKTIPREFRRVDTTRARVVLVEALDRVLPGDFPPELSRRALADLRSMGVEVRLSTRVTTVDDASVTLSHEGGTERIATRNVIWAAGVKATPLTQSLGAPLDKSGRVLVSPDLSAPGRPEVFVLGDLAHVTDPRTHRPIPGMCPAANQMGEHAAKTIAMEARRGTAPGSPMRPAFAYRDKGLLATIGRARAVAHVFGRDFAGFPAWVLWALVHIFFLIGFRSKILVLLDWIWSYVTFGRGSRLITGTTRPGP